MSPRTTGVPELEPCEVPQVVRWQECTGTVHAEQLAWSCWCLLAFSSVGVPSYLDIPPTSPSTGSW